ncbi:phosphoenolpyruvate carboxylase, housekeeping isozyme-like [Dorcoceras hygrometricum]|uniref:Phosphoenolpyruvate carboxylase, housekeeping isozyme-like n=1 Tax=Dorcoceras hygrometricum TaxID=472368 RepID=A0A2Z7BVS7_9LAMI|nr:phosphoenolpyruvate carboxylase, housekeeping isozyme-like [Dorcoceras hygrometricum]
MGKAEMLRVLEETQEAVVPPKKVAKKRKDSTPADKEARRQRNNGAITSRAGPEPWLGDVRAQDKKAAEAMQEALRAQLVTERADRATEEEAMRVELEAVLDEKAAVEVELEETKARAAEEAKRMRDKVANTWAREKEFRANGYSEEEHPAPFLDVKKALREMPEDDEEAKEEEVEEDASGNEATPPRSPR